MACLVDRQPNTSSIVSRYRDGASAPVRQEGDLVGRHGVGGASLKVNTSTLVLCPGDMGGEACSCAAITLIKWSNGVFSASPPEQVLSSQSRGALRKRRRGRGEKREDLLSRASTRLLLSHFTLTRRHSARRRHCCSPPLVTPYRVGG